MKEISIIIPIAREEDEPVELLRDISKFLPDAEIILSSEDGRAQSLNIGAGKSTKGHLWFLHADSKITEKSIKALAEKVKRYPDDLLYFDLKFYDGSKLMRINEFGVWWRSHILKCPFGDQGFSISKDNFDRLGGYDESAEYGEDHLFVWKARKNNINLRAINAPIYTSARKYIENGWWNTTKLHSSLWFKQARKEFASTSTKL